MRSVRLQSCDSYGDRNLAFNQPRQWLGSAAANNLRHNKKGLVCLLQPNCYTAVINDFISK
jgi:hypothetical protein